LHFIPQNFQDLNFYCLLVEVAQTVSFGGPIWRSWSTTSSSDILCRQRNRCGNYRRGRTVLLRTLLVSHHFCPSCTEEKTRLFISEYSRD